MPIYLVRWPRCEASLVRAKNEQELQFILDEVGDPGCARWTVYNGPLYIDLDLPTKRVEGKELEWQVDADTFLTEEGVPYRISFGETESGAQLKEAVTRWAYPHVHAVVEAFEHESATEPVRELPDHRAAAREEKWHERIADAAEADEAEMTVLLHQRQQRQAQAAGLEQYVSQKDLREAAERLGKMIMPPAPPNLTLVRDENDDDEA